MILGALIARDVNEWVELDGELFRWKHLFSRRVSERQVSQIAAIVTLTPAMRTLAVRVAEGIFGRIKGFEFRFPDRKQGIRVFRADPTMTNVRELVEAVVAKMYEHGEVVPEIVDFEGKPLIRRLTLRRLLLPRGSSSPSIVPPRSPKKLRRTLLTAASDSAP